MTRLLTLTGAGGTGKTRLALELAADLIGLYPDGVWLVELAPLSEPSLVPREIVRAVGMREQPERPPEETLPEALRDKNLLLTLDNCEHLVDAVARLIRTLLTECPEVRVLATSREPLGVAGEVLRPVSPLPVPAPTEEIEGLTHYGAINLFVERARLKLPTLRLTGDNACVVAKLCRSLGGIPLAIELAAARVGTLAVEEVAGRLEGSLELLDVGPRTAPGRQRTMRASLEWSYSPLSEPERELFARLSVFAGGWTLEAAEAVGSSVRVEENEVLAHLSGLVDKSLVMAETYSNGSVRYRMLEPVRQYAREKLEESDEAGEVSRRHAAFFVTLAEEAGAELRGPTQLKWLERLEAEHDNLRIAMACMLEDHEVEGAVRLAWGLWMFWLLHGHQVEGGRWMERVVTKADKLSTHLRAKALQVRGVTLYGLDSPERMGRLCEEAAFLFRQVGDRFGLAFAICGLGVSLLQRGNAKRATSLLEEGLGIFREVGDGWGISSALAHLGVIAMAEDDRERAALYFEEGLKLTQETGNSLSGTVSLYSLALAEQVQGNHERAAQLYTEGLKLSVKSGDRVHTAYCLEGFAKLATAGEEPERAARLFGTAEASLEAAGNPLYAQAQDRILYREAVEELRSRLDKATFDANWASGRTMSLEQAAAYVISKEEVSATGAFTPEQSSPGVKACLTSREWEVAVLVSLGLTNRQIAARLCISEHTAATHVRRILKKLRLNSRSQIATWVTERDLPSLS